MSLVSVFQPLIWPSAEGINIAIPIKCTGQATTAEIDLYIYNAAFWGSPGDLIASYTQTVTFAKGEQKDVTFVHSTPESTTGSRDVGIEIKVEGLVVASQIFQDAYSTGEEGGGFDIMSMMSMMMLLMMMGMIMPMITEMMPAEEELPPAAPPERLPPAEEPKLLPQGRTEEGGTL
jgi:hypothetical protein